MKPTKGFTLIELVVVIVILGILAATALPKFVNLGQDARIASVRSLKGTIETAAREGYMLCKMSPTTCNETAWGGSVGINYVNRTGFSLPIRFHYGYPIAWEDHPSHSADSMGIGNLIEYTGFTRPMYVSSSFQAVFTKDGAPEAAKCAVIYKFPSSGGAGVPEVSTLEEGC